MVKNYGIHDEWKDLNKVNDIDIKSVDGVIDSIKVNGEEAGGGGGDYPIFSATMPEDTETNPFTCDWTFTELKAKLEEQTESNSWAGIFVDTSRDGTMGGSCSKESATRIIFLMSDGSELIYHSDGTITVGII